MAEEEEIDSRIMVDVSVRKVRLRDAPATYNKTNKIDKDYTMCKNCWVKVEYRATSRICKAT